MSEENHPITKQDAEDEQRQEDHGGEQPKPVSYRSGGDEKGFKTPDAAEHRIPVFSSSPPPPPKKRKKVFLHKEKLPKHRQLFENTSERNKAELELFFRSPPEDSSVSPEPAAKKRRIEDK